jgi:hypothetical protein
MHSQNLKPTLNHTILASLPVQLQQQRISFNPFRGGAQPEIEAHLQHNIACQFDWQVSQSVTATLLLQQQT